MDHRTLDALAAKHGSLAEWMPSDSELLEATLHARIDEAMSYMSEDDKIVLRMHGREGVTQRRLAGLMRKSQPSVSEHWTRALRRLRYWMALTDLGGSLGRTLREVGARDDDALVLLDWLHGKSIEEASGAPFATGWDAINRVRKALRSSGSQRAKRVLRVIKLRGSYPKV